MAQNGDAAHDAEALLAQMPDRATVLEKLAGVREYKEQVSAMLTRIAALEQNEANEEIKNKLLRTYQGFDEQELQYMGILAQIEKINKLKESGLLAAADDDEDEPQQNGDSNHAAPAPPAQQAVEQEIFEDENGEPTDAELEALRVKRDQLMEMLREKREGPTPPPKPTSLAQSSMSASNERSQQQMPEADPSQTYASPTAAEGSAAPASPGMERAVRLARSLDNVCGNGPTAKDPPLQPAQSLDQLDSEPPQAGEDDQSDDTGPDGEQLPPELLAMKKDASMLKDLLKQQQKKADMLEALKNGLSVKAEGTSSVLNNAEKNQLDFLESLRAKRDELRRTLAESTDLRDRLRSATESVSSGSTPVGDGSPERRLNGDAVQADENVTHSDANAMQADANAMQGATQGTLLVGTSVDENEIVDVSQIEAAVEEDEELIALRQERERLKLLLEEQENMMDREAEKQEKLMAEIQREIAEAQSGQHVDGAMNGSPQDEEEELDDEQTEVLEKQNQDTRAAIEEMKGQAAQLEQIIADQTDMRNMMQREVEKQREWTQNRAETQRDSGSQASRISEIQKKLRGLKETYGSIENVNADTEAPTPEGAVGARRSEIETRLKLLQDRKAKMDEISSSLAEALAGHGADPGDTVNLMRSLLNFSAAIDPILTVPRLSVSPAPPQQAKQPSGPVVVNGRSSKSPSPAVLPNRGEQDETKARELVMLKAKLSQVQGLMNNLETSKTNDERVAAAAELQAMAEEMGMSDEARTNTSSRTTTPAPPSVQQQPPPHQPSIPVQPVQPQQQQAEAEIDATRSSISELQAENERLLDLKRQLMEKVALKRQLEEDQSQPPPMYHGAQSSPQVARKPMLLPGGMPQTVIGGRSPASHKPELQRFFAKPPVADRPRASASNSRHNSSIDAETDEENLESMASVVSAPPEDRQRRRSSLRSAPSGGVGQQGGMGGKAGSMYGPRRGSVQATVPQQGRDRSPNPGLEPPRPYSRQNSASLSQQYEQLQGHIDSIRDIFQQVLNQDELPPVSQAMSSQVQQARSDTPATPPVPGQTTPYSLNGALSLQSIPEDCFFNLKLAKYNSEYYPGSWPNGGPPPSNTSDGGFGVQQQQLLIQTMLNCQQQMHYQQMELQRLQMLCSDLLRNQADQQGPTGAQQGAQQHLGGRRGSFSLQQSDLLQPVVPMPPPTNPGYAPMPQAVPGYDTRPLSHGSLYNLLAPNPYLTSPYYPSSNTMPPPPVPPEYNSPHPGYPPVPPSHQHQPSWPKYNNTHPHQHPGGPQTGPSTPTGAGPPYSSPWQHLNNATRLSGSTSSLNNQQPNLHPVAAGLYGKSPSQSEMLDVYYSNNNFPTNFDPPRTFDSGAVPRARSARFVSEGSDRPGPADYGVYPGLPPPQGGGRASRHQRRRGSGANSGGGMAQPIDTEWSAHQHRSNQEDEEDDGSYFRAGNPSTLPRSGNKHRSAGVGVASGPPQGYGLSGYGHHSAARGGQQRGYDPKMELEQIYKSNVAKKQKNFVPQQQAHAHQQQQYHDAYGGQQFESVFANATLDNVRDMVYAEVAAMIGRHDGQPEYLLELLKEIQNIPREGVKARALNAIRDVLMRYLSNDGAYMDEQNRGTVQKLLHLAELEQQALQNTSTTDSPLTSPTDTTGPMMSAEEGPDGRIYHHPSLQHHQRYGSGSGSGIKTYDSLKGIPNVKTAGSLNNEVRPAEERAALARIQNNDTAAPSHQHQSSGGGDAKSKSPSAALGPSLEAMIAEVVDGLIPFIQSQPVTAIASPQILAVVRQNGSSSEWTTSNFRIAICRVAAESRLPAPSPLSVCADELLEQVSEVLNNELPFYRMMQTIGHSTAAPAKRRSPFGSIDKSQSDHAGAQAFPPRAPPSRSMAGAPSGGSLIRSRIAAFEQAGPGPDESSRQSFPARRPSPTGSPHTPSSPHPQHQHPANRPRPTGTASGRPGVVVLSPPLPKVEVIAPTDEEGSEHLRSSSGEVQSSSTDSTGVIKIKTKRSPQPTPPARAAPVGSRNGVRSVVTPVAGVEDGIESPPEESQSMHTAADRQAAPQNGDGPVESGTGSSRETTPPDDGDLPQDGVPRADDSQDDQL